MTSTPAWGSSAYSGNCASPPLPTRRRAETEPCERRRRDAELTQQIQRIHADSGGIYGSPRVHAVLKREDVHVGRKRVERLMREAELAGLSPRRKGFTRRDPKPRSHPTWSTATSPPRHRTGCGSRT
ncbi:IS3 family transposase [Streptomyces sioyaensis]|uniref:IS3 family transposase n=1 Tax=Streptomyces sioyaensis TaxID=67364 RepID=UPI0037BBA3F7